MLTEKNQNTSFGVKHIQSRASNSFWAWRYLPKSTKYKKKLESAGRHIVFFGYEMWRGYPEQWAAIRTIECANSRFRDWNHTRSGPSRELTILIWKTSEQRSDSIILHSPAEYGVLLGCFDALEVIRAASKFSKIVSEILEKSIFKTSDCDWSTTLNEGQNCSEIASPASDWTFHAQYHSQSVWFGHISVRNRQIIPKQMITANFKKFIRASADSQKVSHEIRERSLE